MLSGMWGGLLAIGAFLLAAAGLAKARHPGSAQQALKTAGLAIPASAVRAGALIEGALGVAALIAGWWYLAAGVALSYLLFAAAVAQARRAPDAASCGCFGRSGAPPSARHVVFDLAMAAGAALGAVTHPASLGVLAWHHPVYGAIFAVVTLTGAWLGYLVLEGAQGTPSGLEAP